MQAIFENILNRNFEWPTDPECQLSEDCHDLIERLLDPDPDSRLGARGAGEVNNSLYFTFALNTISQNFLVKTSPLLYSVKTLMLYCSLPNAPLFKLFFTLQSL